LARVKKKANLAWQVPPSLVGEHCSSFMESMQALRGRFKSAELRERGHSIELGERVYSTKQSEDPFINEDTKIHSSLHRSRSSSAHLSSCIVCLRESRLRFSLLSFPGRVVLLVFLPLLLAHVFLGTTDLLFHYYGPKDTRSVATDTSFAVVINTYKRPQMLKQAVQHYADKCGQRVGVSQVFVVWAELGVTPPDPTSFFPQTVRKKSLQNRASVQIIRVEKDSLNSRFLPIANLQSQAIFMVDDDVRVDCFSLHQGFVAWKAFPDSMVGYYPRLAAPFQHEKLSSVLDYVYQAWPIVFWRHQVNFILTKASFLHERYLQLYTDSPPEIRDYVDKFFNCEDVAMSMLVANYTKSLHGKPARPIYVEGSVTDKGLFNGISTGTGHMEQRSHCLTDLTSIYLKHGWEAPLQETFELKEASWVHHAPGFWWQFRPSNFFEWFALENVFK